MKPYHLYNENPCNGKAKILYLDAPCKPKLLDCIDKILYMPYESYQVGDVIFSHMILNPNVYASGYQVVCGRWMHQESWQLWNQSKGHSLFYVVYPEK